MARGSNTKTGNWLKRIVVALIAAVAGLLFTKRKVKAPSHSSSEYELPPVPDVPPAGAEEATPLTEEEHRRLAGQENEPAGESTPNGSTGAPPAPISYEAAARGAAEAEAARAEGTEEGRRRADAIDQRMYFGAPPAGEAPVEPSSTVESVDNPDAEIADAGDERSSDADNSGVGGTGTDGGGSIDQSASATSTFAGIRARPGDTAPDSTSEGYDVSDGADHTGRDQVDNEDPTDVGLDVDVDLDDDEDAAPDPTSEGFDTSGGSGGDSPIGAAASAGALTSGEEGEGYVRLSGDARDCPEDFPIKGNATSRIYHLPGESSYDATIPEICFATSDVAESMGFRARKR